MRIEEFHRLLEKQVPSLILLYGQEALLLEQQVQSIRQSIFPGGTDDFNDQLFAGNKTTAQQILDHAQTFPVFAARRLVTVQSFQDMPTAEQDRLINYLEDPAPETTLLLVADKIDNRRRFFQIFKKHGVVLKCDPLTERELPGYVRGMLRQNGVRMSPEALQHFCSLVDTSLHEVHSELDKLCLFVGPQRQIEIDDVETIVSRSRAESVFALGAAIGRADKAQALELLRRLYTANEPPLLLLNLVTGHFRLLWKVTALQASNYAPAQIAKEVQRPPFVVERLLRETRRLAEGDFFQIYRLLLDADLEMKSSGADPQVLFEQLVINLTQLLGARAT